MIKYFKSIPQIHYFVFLTAFFAVFLKFWEPGIGLSSTTYGAFAANIVNGQSPLNFRLGVGAFDPFVDHPPLIIWFQALCFWLFGISAQILRLPASILGVIAIFCTYWLSQKKFDATSAVFSVLALLLTNTFMNFTSSGWLDMGMVGFTMLGIATFESFLDDRSKIKLALSGLFFSAALLSKGLAAMALLPIAIYILYQRLRLSEMALLAVSALLPIALFDGLFYNLHHREFFSWYSLRREVNAAEMARVYTEKANVTWYIRELFFRSHVFFIAMFIGVFKYFKSRASKATNTTPFIILCLGQIVVHSLVYGFTNKEYNQYLVPSFPWIAILAGVGCSSLFKKMNADKFARGLCITLLTIFVAATLISKKVHMGEDNEIRAMNSTVAELSELKRIRIRALPGDQHSWEGLASYAAWYLNLEPTLHSPEDLLKNITPQEAVLADNSIKDMPHAAMLALGFRLCLTGQTFTLYAHESICTTERLTKRTPPSDKMGAFSR
ncbi:ArnT family glycosyltransferase [Bdellovibrio sp. HCB209]|uniref:ArnT family glycosyltransferase n=1 Tax=Bdellovibrio sp. HCB209 TaxID=3394354 RepID=UPI0039B41D48